MSRPVVTTVSLIAAVSNGICQTQTPPPSNGLVFNGSLVNAAGVAVLDSARCIAIASTGNDSGITFTITGTTRPEAPELTLVEVIAGSNGGTAVSTRNFKTVTSIVASGPVAGAITVGTNGIASGPWVVWNNFVADFNVGIAGIVISGNPQWQIDYTYDDVFGTWPHPGTTFASIFPLPTMTNVFGNLDGRISGTGVRATRLTLMSAPGIVQCTQLQQGG